MNIMFESENLGGRDHLRILGVDEREYNIKMDLT
jgi:hypothetical protein